MRQTTQMGQAPLKSSPERSYFFDWSRRASLKQSLGKFADSPDGYSETLLDESVARNGTV
jgi:hypothetical protein